jgi:uncharacterized protein (TIRG00374 family)
MRRMAARWGALGCSLAILAVIYAHIDLASLAARLLRADPLWLGLALACFLPQVLVTATRWWIMGSGWAHMGWAESFGMVMAGKALNALLPSKLGEMSKAYFLKQRGQVSMAKGLPAVFMEKLLDLAALCSWMLLGATQAPSGSGAVTAAWVISLGVVGATAFLLVLPLGRWRGLLEGEGRGLRARLVGILEGWDSLLAHWRETPVVLIGIVGLSVLLWGLHLLQIYLFFPSLGQPVGLGPVLAYVPLSLLVGLLPISLAGMGTRDTALILLFSPYADGATMAGIGLLCTMRYWADTLMGVPFLHRYTSRVALKFQVGSQQ